MKALATIIVVVVSFAVIFGAIAFTAAFSGNAAVSLMVMIGITAGVGWLMSTTIERYL